MVPRGCWRQGQARDAQPFASKLAFEKNQHFRRVEGSEWRFAHENWWDKSCSNIFFFEWKRVCWKTEVQGIGVVLKLYRLPGGRDHLYSKLSKRFELPRAGFGQDPPCGCCLLGFKPSKTLQNHKFQRTKWSGHQKSYTSWKVLLTHVPPFLRKRVPFRSPSVAWEARAMQTKFGFRPEDPSEAKRW